MHQSGAKAVNDIELSKGLGWFSLALGALELLTARRISKMMGIASPKVVWAFGAREVASGVMVLKKPDVAMPIWSRVAGDAVDAAVLLACLKAGNRQRRAAAVAMLLVLGAATLDVAVASALSRREQKALHTASRTRVRSSGAV
jgi:hypothetical protein